MNALHIQIREKRSILRGIYGGMMSLRDLSKELGMKPAAAKVWAQNHGLGNQVGTRVKYETDEVARRIVEGRGMC